MVTQSETPLELWDETKEHLANMANIPVGAQAAPKQQAAPASSSNPSPFAPAPQSTQQVRFNQ
eukprot:376030-Prorocentrum_lima.AAC.1